MTTGWWLLTTPREGGIIAEAQSEFGARCEAIRLRCPLVVEATPLPLADLPPYASRNRWLAPNELWNTIRPRRAS